MPPGQPVTRYRDLARGDPDRYGRLADALIGQRVWVARRGIWYVSAAHTETDVAETLDRAERAFRAFRWVTDRAGRRWPAGRARRWWWLAAAAGW